MIRMYYNYIARKVLANLPDSLKSSFGKELLSTNLENYFHSNSYLRINARRLEHLASLRIPVSGMKVLEVGAGIGDHSHYYLDRGCQLIITDARLENLEYLKKRYSNEMNQKIKISYLDMDDPLPVPNAPFDVVHCYGLLYHLKNPEKALEFMSLNCTKILFLETCVSFGSTKDLNLINENQSDPTQAYSGVGCRPTRAWLFDKLHDLFKYVHIPKTQPNHVEFPIDWSDKDNARASGNLSRAIFIASRGKIDNSLLSSDLLIKQERHP